MPVFCRLLQLSSPWRLVVGILLLLVGLPLFLTPVPVGIFFLVPGLLLVWLTLPGLKRRWQWLQRFSPRTHQWLQRWHLRCKSSCRSEKR